MLFNHMADTQAPEEKVMLRVKGSAESKHQEFSGTQAAKLLNYPNSQWERVPAGAAKTAALPAAGATAAQPAASATTDAAGEAETPAAGKSKARTS